VGPVLRRHGEVESQDKRQDKGNGEYGELDHSYHPAMVPGEITGDPVGAKTWHGDQIP
jgi:hypothetical protein